MKCISFEECFETNLPMKNMEVHASQKGSKLLKHFYNNR
jgi:hypothetical protein